MPEPPGAHARRLLTEIHAAGVAAAAPGPLTAAAVAALPLTPPGRVWMMGIGKAAPQMSAAALAALGEIDYLPAGGLVVGAASLDAPLSPLESLIGDHPLPGAASRHAAARLADIVERVQRDDHAIVLLSGGASSLIAAPVADVSPADLATAFGLLLASGLDIGEMNAVRKRLTRWGGGRLSAALAPAAVHCLAISDVVGDDLAVIGSGPCVADPLAGRDIIALLHDARLWSRMPASVRRHLVAVDAGDRPETPKPGDPRLAGTTARVIAGATSALDGAAARARALGIEQVRVETVPLTGEAALRGEQLALALLRLRETLGSAVRERGGPPAACIIHGGETTVTLGDTPGLGGRCQELALAAARALDAAGDSGRGIGLLAAGTDGRDGPTDAAGAVVDATTWRAISGAGRDPSRDLAAHDAYRALAAASALLHTGVTGTNVGDLIVGIVD